MRRRQFNYLFIGTFLTILSGCSIHETEKEEQVFQSNNQELVRPSIDTQQENTSKVSVEELRMKFYGCKARN